MKAVIYWVFMIAIGYYGVCYLRDLPALCAWEMNPSDFCLSLKKDF
jgi:hypothetical protein